MRHRYVAAYVDTEAQTRVCADCAERQYTPDQLDTLAIDSSLGTTVDSLEYCDACGWLLDGYSLTTEALEAAVSTYTSAAVSALAQSRHAATMAAVEALAEDTPAAPGGQPYSLAALRDYIADHGMWRPQLETAVLVAWQATEALWCL